MDAFALRISSGETKLAASCPAASWTPPTCTCTASSATTRLVSPIVRRKDEAAHGEYHTKRVILEIYDDMKQAMHTCHPYETRLDPPPADSRVAHPPKASNE